MRINVLGFIVLGCFMAVSSYADILSEYNSRKLTANASNVYAVKAKQIKRSLLEKAGINQIAQDQSVNFFVMDTIASIDIAVRDQSNTLCIGEVRVNRSDASFSGKCQSGRIECISADNVLTKHVEDLKCE